ncbi:MAG: DUF2167 domain-containing protein [Agarilytica sp.]
MRHLLLAGIFFILTSPLSFAESEEQTSTNDSEEAYLAWATEIWDSLNRQTGQISIAQAGATLNVPENFYYLDAQDADKVLVEVWGNPPGQTTLGMLFPAEMTPFDPNSWAVTIEYEEDGFVSDEDADDIDYSDLLKDMKKDTEQASAERVKMGYESIALVGWAAPPYYDAQSHKLHWAKELKFANNEINTLNYNIRILGRKGVLVLNFIAGMDQKAIIDSNLDTVLALADFDQGSRYTDFNPDLDKVAAYGLGALVAGKVISKAGFLAVAIVFLKKFGVFIVVGLGLFAKRLFSRK